jgi:hypothetical protein
MRPIYSQNKKLVFLGYTNRRQETEFSGHNSCCEQVSSKTLGDCVPGASQGTRISVSRNNFDMFRISVQTSLKN